MNSDILIVGGGFPAIYSAWRLARDGMKVCLIEESDHLGGALWSRSWKEYLVDIGMQNFDLRTALGAEFFADILGSNLTILEHHYWASSTGCHLSPSLEVPDFSQTDPDLCQTALQELHLLKDFDAPIAAERLNEYLAANFGPTLGRYLQRIAEKIVAGPIDDLSSAAMANLGTIARAKLGPDAQMEELKLASPFMDARLAVSLATNIAAFKGASVNCAFGYPKTGALRSFCILAQSRLVELGVDLHLNTRPDTIIAIKDGVEIRAADKRFVTGRLFWTMDYNGLLRHLGIDADLRAVNHAFGAALHAFEVAADAVRAPDYMHDFALNRDGFRYSRCGHFSNQITANGHTFVLAETPCNPQHADQAKSDATRDKAWSDMVQAGFLDADAQMLDASTFVFPFAYAVPKIGWQSVYAQTRAQIDVLTSRISRIERPLHGRLAFMNQYDSILHHELTS